MRQEIFKTYRYIPRPQGIQEHHLPLFESAFRVLQAKGQPLVVFTTNYDPAVEDLCEALGDAYELIDGFDNDSAAKRYVWNRRHFDQYQGPASKKNVVLFKLHGSTSWTNTPKGIMRSPASIFSAGDAMHQNVLIYPAKKKVASEEPFFTAYDYFQRCMENCKLCLTVGYSFRDEDALSRLKSAARVNQALKVVVLDPSSSSICSKKLVPFGIKAEPIGRNFEDMSRDVNLRSLIQDALAAAVSATT